MTEVLKRPASFIRIEFWAITALFSFAFFFFVINGFAIDDDTALHNTTPYKVFFDKAEVPFHFYKNYFIPQGINHLFRFVLVLYLNFIIIPKLLRKKGLPGNVFFLIILIGLAGIVFGITNTYLMSYQYEGSQSRGAVTQKMFRDGFLHAFAVIWFLILYNAVKYAGIYLFAISEKIEARYPFIKGEAIVATGIWMAGLLLLRFARAEERFLIGWLIVPPTAIALYLLSFYKLIPRSLARNRLPFFFYVFQCAAILLLVFFAVYFVAVFTIRKDDAGVGYSAFNLVFQLFITVPVTWFLYKRRLKGNEEMDKLQNELKRSGASLHFLRSQINPHFLFNALNTLYGTALQENAERTGEGIQKLGDMMRFMLQENMQDRIALTRETDYLNNYISLQKLRIGDNPNVHIQTNVQEDENNFQIVPMLLIPFVENAFKHGISFKEPAQIKINLTVKDGLLYFDVYNSRHARPDNDPEKNKSGIGLDNVKQRLQLAYPGKHELMIRETTTDFFVHLTLQLAKFA